ncbi:MAG: DbpA RNA binding domain-containing protein, partial [Verrucomicrobiales bacterium]
ANQPIQEGFTRLFLNLGKAIGVTPKGLLGMLYGEGNLPPGAVGRVQIFPKHSLVEVRKEHAETLLAALANAKFRGKSFRADHDRHA